MNSSPATPPDSLNVGYSTYKSKRHSRHSSVNAQNIFNSPREDSPLTNGSYQPSEHGQLVSLSSSPMLNALVNGTATPVQSPRTPTPPVRASSPPPKDLKGKGPAIAPYTNGDPVSHSSHMNGLASLIPDPVVLATSPPSPGPSTSSPAQSEQSLPSISPIPSRPTSTIGSAISMQSVGSSTVASSSTKPHLRSTTSTFRHLPLRQPANPSPLRSSSSMSGTFRRLPMSTPISPHSDAFGASSLPSPSLRTLSTSPSGSTLRPARVLSPISQPSGMPEGRRLSMTAGTPSQPSTPTTAQPVMEPTPQMKPSPLATPPVVASPPPPPPSSLSNPTPPPVVFTPTSQITSTAPSRPSSSGASGPSASTSTITIKSGPAPYRPGFQPKGVYNLRTDEFIALRSQKVEGRQASEKRLLRRLEKLIELHFTPEAAKAPLRSPSPSTPTTPSTPRRNSSIFDFSVSDLKSTSASDLFKTVLENKSEKHIRDVEQSITHWEDDKSVSSCPICTSNFNSLTNRKHHCRLCGRIICSLPPKPPQRVKTCSLLIKADWKTGRIEEVPELIAYGVASRREGSEGVKEAEGLGKGVRICRDCDGIVQRQQFVVESAKVPTYARLHQALIKIENQIEASLPQFHELVLALSTVDPSHPSTDSQRQAIATRKELLDTFARYDAIAKKIGTLPCVPGSSQDKVQRSILLRANLFLQTHMFPLKSLANFQNREKPSREPTRTITLSELTNPGSPKPNGHTNHHPSPPPIPPESTVAKSLQPLLEQEALLEMYLEEANAARKFEDAKSLKTSLREIREEIARITKNNGIL
ncbi:carboxypeptidase Y-deficient [Tulasnella sp. 419]|nr:carboxypeptidase Y-deficient [Tulasnella sp. 419]